MHCVYVTVMQIIFALPSKQQLSIFDTLGLFSIQNPDDTSYDIGSLVNQLNLQFCSIVEVGEGYCNVSKTWSLHIRLLLFSFIMVKYRILFELFFMLLILLK